MMPHQLHYEWDGDDFGLFGFTFHVETDGHEIISAYVEMPGAVPKGLEGSIEMWWCAQHEYYFGQRLDDEAETRADRIYHNQKEEEVAQALWEQK